MRQKETSETREYEAIIDERLRNIIDSKSNENEEAIGRLKALETSWKALNSDLEQEIKSEFDNMALEENSTKRALNLLDKNSCVSVQENAFVIAGKVIDEESKIGLPGLLTKISKRVKKEENVPIETYSDHFGNFTGTILLDEKDEPEGREEKKQTLLFSFFLENGKTVYKEERRMQIKAGIVEKIIISVPCTPELSDQKEGGKYVRDSVEKDAELVKLRFKNMKEANTAISRMAEVGLEDIRELAEELSIAPPGLPERTEDVICKPERKSGPLPRISVEEEADDITETNDFITVGLEEINGIGPVTARNLRNEGIKDALKFLEADEDNLKKIMGNVDISEMKKYAASLLEKKKDNN